MLTTVLTVRCAAKAEANTLVPHQLVPVFVEHNEVQSKFMVLTVHGFMASAGVFSYARHYGVARKCLR